MISSDEELSERRDTALVPRPSCIQQTRDIAPEVWKDLTSMLVGYFRRSSVKPQDVDDLVQQVLTTIVDEDERPDDFDDLSRWTKAFAYYAVLRYRTRQARLNRRQSKTEVEIRQSGPSSPTHASNGKDIGAYLRLLEDPGERAVLWLQVETDLKPKEIAAVIGVSDRHIRRLAGQAKITLSKLVER